MNAEKSSLTREEYITATARNIMALIRDDPQVPCDIGDYGSLHDFTDANWYAAFAVVPNPASSPDVLCACNWAQTWVHTPDCLTQSPRPEWWNTRTDEWYTTLMNDVTSMVDTLLCERARNIRAGHVEAQGDDKENLRNILPRKPDAWTSHPLVSAFRIRGIASAAGGSDADEEVFVPWDGNTLCIKASTEADGYNWQLLDQDAQQIQAGSWHPASINAVVTKITGVITGTCRLDS